MVVPAAVASAHLHRGEAGRHWIAGLPALAETFLERWRLRRDGPARAGAVALVLPVRRPGGEPAVLKLQPVDDETVGEPAALRTWRGQGAVRLLAHDRGSGTMLLERLDPARSLAAVPDDLAALRILTALLGRLVAVPAPGGLRRLDDLVGDLLERLPGLVDRLADPADRRLLATCAGAVADLLPVREHRLLHWDLHYDNVLAGVREPWLAIDPKPIAGEPGFELWPALWNRWDDVIATGNVAGAVRHRFDLMVDALDLDRPRAAAWTLGRVLQVALWDVAAGIAAVDPVPAAIARALLPRAGLRAPAGG